MELWNNVPFRSTTDSVFHDLGFLDRANLLKECNQLLGPKSRSQLLNKDSSTIALVFS